MKKFFMLISRVNVLFILAFVILSVFNISGQTTIVIPTNKSGDVKVDQSALPVLAETPFETKNRTAKGGQGFSVASGKPKGNISPESETFFCSTPNSYQRSRGNFDIKAVGAIDCGNNGVTPCYWTKPFILVGFINGTPELKQVVKEVISEWTTWANIGFIVDENSNFTGDSADIKISFNADGKHNSFIGVDSWHSSVRTGKNAPTMNLGYLNRQLRSADGQVLSSVKGTILHEFGHSLGLQHEHQNPAGGIRWNREAVIAELSGPPNNWTTDIIERNIFQALNRNLTQFTQHDPSSVMHYSFPANWTQNNIAIPDNDDLSETDKSFIASKYPRKKAILNTNQYYRLTTWFNNRSNCLGVGQSTSADGVTSYFPYFYACDNNASGQRWKFTKMSNGDYRLTNQFMGDNVSLNDSGLGYYSDLNASGNYSNQYWTITSLDKYFRLSSMLNGQYYSLTTELNPNTRTYMTRTAHWSNQLWEFVPAGAIR